MDQSFLDPLLIFLIDGRPRERLSTFGAGYTTRVELAILAMTFRELSEALNVTLVT